MKKLNKELLKKNPKLDQNVISAANALQNKLPGIAEPKQGSDFRISPPLGGKILILNHHD